MEAPSGVAWVVPAGLPTKSIDISECFVLWSLRGIAFPFVVYCLFFFMGASGPIKTYLNMGPLCGLEIHSPLMSRVSVGLLWCRLPRQPLHLSDLYGRPSLACFCLVSPSVSIRTDLEREQPCINPRDKNFH